MMTTTEILNEIQRLPLNQQKELKDKLLQNSESNGETQPKMTQDEFDRMLFEDGFLVNLPVIVDEDDEFEPVKFSGKPISETIIEERR
jgi:hypothetical protein